MQETQKVKKLAAKKGKKPDELTTLVDGLGKISSSWYDQIKARWAKNYGHWRNVNSNNLFENNKKDLPIAIAWMVVDGLISAMTDGRPKPVFLPEEGADKKMAEAVARIISGPVWEELRSDETNEQVIKAALVLSGAGVTKMGVDERRRFYDAYVDPYHCFPEPNVNNINDMEFFMTKVPVSVGKIKYAFKGQADHVRAQEIDDERRMYMGAEKAYSMSADYKMNIWGNDDDKDSSGFNRSYGRAMLEHIWLADYKIGEIPFTSEEVEEEHARAGKFDIEVHDWENHVKHIQQHTRYIREIQKKYDFSQLANPQTGLPMFEQNFEVFAPDMENDVRTITALVAHINEHADYPQVETGLVYPHGREIWVCQGQVLLERASVFGNPYKAFQFDRDIAGDFWNKSLIDYIVPIQEAFNRLITKVDRHADVVANGRCFYNVRSNILWDKVLAKYKERGGRLVNMGIPVNGPPRDNVMWDYGGQMPAYVFNLLGMLERLAYSIGGYTEVMQGQIPDYASGAALGKAIQSAGVRIRKGVKHLGWYYRDKYRDYVKYLKHTDPLQIYKIIGENDELAYKAWMDVDWDAMRDVRIDVRNVLGTYREEQFAKLQAILQASPQLARILLPAMLEFMDVAVDTKPLQKEQDLQNMLGVAHDELTMAKAGIAKAGMAGGNGR